MNIYIYIYLSIYKHKWVYADLERNVEVNAKKANACMLGKRSLAYSGDQNLAGF